MSEIVTYRRWWVAVFLPGRPGKERKLVSKERETETEIIPGPAISYSFRYITSLPQSYNKHALFAYVWSRWVSFMRVRWRVCVWGISTLDWQPFEGLKKTFISTPDPGNAFGVYSHLKKKPIGTLITCYIFLTSILVFAPLCKYTTLTRFLVWYSGIVRMPASSQRFQHACILFFKTTSTPA